MNEMDRRVFLEMALKAVMSVGLGVVAGGIGYLGAKRQIDYDQTHRRSETGIDVDLSPQLSWEEVSSFVHRFDGLYDQLPPHEFPLTEANNWLAEFMPVYVTGDIGRSGEITLTTEDFRDPNWYVGTLGATQCIQRSITLSGRYENPASNKYNPQSPEWVWVLAHESSHASGICGTWDGRSETSANLAAIEMLSTLVNMGNRRAIYPLLWGLRQIGFYAAVHVGLRDNEREKVIGLVNDIHHDMFETSPAEQLLLATEDLPVWITVMANTRVYGYNTVLGLLAAEQNNYETVNTIKYQPSVEIPREGTWQMDDTFYFFAHAGEMVKAL